MILVAVCLVTASRAFGALTHERVSIDMARCRHPVVPTEQSPYWPLQVIIRLHRSKKAVRLGVGKEGRGCSFVTLGPYAT